MAERRMFSKRVVNSARFLKMPVSTQALYFHLGLHADDDGIVEAYTVMNSVGACEDDLKVLVAKGFIHVLNEDLVTYITDWNENNKIRADRKIDSIYRDLLIQILPDVPLLQKKQRADVKKKLIECEQPMDNQWTADGQPMDGIGKDRIGKDRIGKEKKNNKKKAPLKKNKEAPQAIVNDNTRANEKQGNKFTQIINEFTDNENLRATILEYIKMRKLNKSHMTERALKLALKKLKELGSNESEQIKILEQSIMNCWKGLFPLKEQTNNGSVENGAAKREDKNHDERYGLWL